MRARRDTMTTFRQEKIQIRVVWLAAAISAGLLALAAAITWSDVDPSGAPPAAAEAFEGAIPQP